MNRLMLVLLMLVATSGASQQKVYYQNPILAGFYPDPSICRAGDDYYLVNSSFAYFPGLPLFHSRDLVNWKQIGHAMDRPSQLPLEGAGVSRGLFAPAITYHNGVFYIVCTLIDKMGNFVITATNPKGPWSDPVPLPEVNGIDPSLYIAENGKAWILYNSIPPGNNSLYDGHRTIRMYEFDTRALRVTGDEKILVNGGTDITKKPVWIEGPHILKKDGWYYLLCAEGGTGYNHSEVVFRSRAIDGPYESYKNNPILTQRHLDPARANPITTTGHADFIDTKDGKWYAVFLGCRPYEGEHFNTGRETFMAPVTWKDGWPHILEGKEEVAYRYPVPMPGVTKKVNNPFSGNFIFRDEFNVPKLDNRWIFLRTLRKPWYDLSTRKGSLGINMQDATCGGKRNPSFIAHRQQHLNCSASTMVDFNPTTAEQKAGIVIFQNETHFYYLCIGIDSLQQGNGKRVELFRSTADSNRMELLSSRALPAGSGSSIQLKIEANGALYRFSYALTGDSWQLLTGDIDGKFLSTKTAGGFVGTVFALYVTSMGIKDFDNTAYFDWFEYTGNDKVHDK